MRNKLAALIESMLAKRGFEEIIDPNNPLIEQKKLVEQEPDSWRIAYQLIHAAQAKDLASRLPEGAAKQAVIKSSNAAVAQIIDDWCGTPPRRHPWPWPGPPPWAWEVTSNLSLFANSLVAGSLRDEVLGIAGKLTVVEQGRAG